MFYKPRQGALFDPGDKDLKGPMFDQTLCYAFGGIMVIRRTVLRLVGFPDNIGGRRKNAEIKGILYVSGNQTVVLS